VAAQTDRCQNNLRRIIQAMEAYHQAHGQYPPAYTVDENGKPMHSWRVLILPYLGPEEKLLYGQFNMAEPWNGPTNSYVSSRMPDVFACSTDPESVDGVTSYMVVVGPGLLFDTGKKMTRTDVDRGDGASQTIMVVEVTESGVPWAQPIDMDLRQLAQGVNSGIAGTCSSHHPQAGMHAGLVDGTVKFLSDSTSAEELKAMCTVNGGEIVRLPD
jgi:hypothetical protein